VNTDEFSVYEAVGIIFIAGFAIQQVLQMLDPVVMGAIAWYKAKRTKNNKPSLPGGMSDEGFKKSVMYVLGFLLGVVVVLFTRIRLLYYVRPEWGGGLADFFISALVIGSGTEGVNTFLKLLSYVKDSQNPLYKSPDISVSIQPSDVPVASGGTVKFYALVSNTTNKTVRWDVVQGATGGTIDSTGLYTAPAAVGTYQVRAISDVDPEKMNSATIHVS